ncbi:AAA family ATPase [Micromonospora sp. NPDC006766]|uniref:AAA family ATPase n=1 Tax=Micromonospora sp. NPDC006766 TaxID=3154778 RepID=UPI0033D8453F
MGTTPTLVVISGPSAAGKTTLAHLLARRIGCPAICRDEIKEGMVHAAGDFIAAPSDELTLRTLPTFFTVLHLLLTAGVTTVAEAAFQDHVWRPGLQPLVGVADIRVVHCQVAARTAFNRIQRRQDKNATRHAHADAYLGDHQTHAVGHHGFQPVRLDVPEIEVDTSGGYRPDLDEIVAFVNAGRSATRGSHP